MSHLPSNSCHAVKNLRKVLMARVMIWDRLKDWWRERNLWKRLAYLFTPDSQHCPLQHAVLRGPQLPKSGDKTLRVHSNNPPYAYIWTHRLQRSLLPLRNVPGTGVRFSGVYTLTSHPGEGTRGSTPGLTPRWPPGRSRCCRTWRTASACTPAPPAGRGAASGRRGGPSWKRGRGGPIRPVVLGLYKRCQSVHRFPDFFSYPRQ